MCTLSRRGLHYHHRHFASVQEPSELDFESSLPARRKWVTLMQQPPLCLCARASPPPPALGILSRTPSHLRASSSMQALSVAVPNMLFTQLGIEGRETGREERKEKESM